MNHIKRDLKPLGLHKLSKNVGTFDENQHSHINAEMSTKMNKKRSITCLQLGQQPVFIFHGNFILLSELLPELDLESRSRC